MSDTKGLTHTKDDDIARGRRIAERWGDSLTTRDGIDRTFWRWSVDALPQVFINLAIVDYSSPENAYETLGAYVRKIVDAVGIENMV